MDRLPPTLALLALFALILAAMWWGWRSRGARQSALPAPHPDSDLIDLDGGIAAGPFEATYVSTVLAGEPLERIVAHGLGSRSRAHLSRGTSGSWRIQRDGAPSFTIPADQVHEITTASGMAGKSVGGSGLLVIRWQNGPDAPTLDTGFRMARRADHDLLLSRKENA